MPPHPLTNFEIQKYYENEPRFSGVDSRNNLSKITEGAHIINRDGYKSLETHRIALYLNDNNVTCFDNFGVEHIPKEIRKYIGNKNIIKNTYKVRAYDSAMYGCFCIGFIDFTLKGKSLLEYRNLFSPNSYENNDKIILKHFQ